MSKANVDHDVGANAFVIHLGKDGKEKALLEYVKEGDVLNLWHTEVPVNHRRQGLGAHLAKAALDHAVEKNYQVKPTCTYIQKYLKDNPLAEYTERVIPID
ncbi:protein NATD1 [Exaiptasia diaphana]|uniref:Protein NATD1 n=1 Tax=Exaiptasia diaphana TaxID=2652724 RepID=A0A913XDJ3_EXADI|nr:protein NATD1 [Exaiptasia diaphana]KXJ20476.1 Protein NATD1 [Exaiptasia diaphana]